MDLTSDEYEPVILLNDGETFSGLGGCQLIAPKRTFDLEKIVRWAFANGYRR
jgi:hypothetical protein